LRRARLKFACFSRQRQPGAQADLKAFGAELVLTNPLEGTDGAIRRVRELVAAEPDKALS
jgi:cysteine synthase B